MYYEWKKITGMFLFSVFYFHCSFFLYWHFSSKSVQFLINDANFVFSLLKSVFELDTDMTECKWTSHLDTWNEELKWSQW